MCVRPTRFHGIGARRQLRLELEDLEDAAARHANPADLAARRRSPSTPKKLRTRSGGVSATPTSGQPKTSQ